MRKGEEAMRRQRKIGRKNYLDGQIKEATNAREPGEEIKRMHLRSPGEKEADPKSNYLKLNEGRAFRHDVRTPLNTMNMGFAMLSHPSIAADVPQELMTANQQAIQKLTKALDGFMEDVEPAAGPDRLSYREYLENVKPKDREKIEDASRKLAIEAAGQKPSLEKIREGLEAQDYAGQAQMPQKSIIKAVKTASAMIDDYRQVVETGEKPLKLEETDVNKLAKDAVTQSRLTAEGMSHKLDLKAESRIPADPHQLGKVFQNIVNNAVDSMERRRREDSGHTPLLEVSTRETGDHLQVSFKDNGAGIRPSKLGEVVKPGYTTKEGDHGGEGLDISKKLIEKHYGWLEVDSPGVGQGAVVKVTLPKNLDVT